MKTYRICLLPGDGIGPEVINQAVQVLKSLPIEFEFNEAKIGYNAFLQTGTPLPDVTLEKIRNSDATLFGAVTTPPQIPGYFSPIVRMRQVLDLYANIRPCISIPHPSSRDNVHLVIVRENTEGLYSGVERMDPDGSRAVTERIITRYASARIIRKAFQVAQDRNTSVTVVHKANILRMSCGLFRQVALEVSRDYPQIPMLEMLVDTCAMELIRDPSQFGVIVTTNLFGDILSDEAAMLVGGLGVAPSANIGENIAVFEPIHGSAPALAGKNTANPMAAIRAAGMMLDHLGEHQAARWIEESIHSNIQNKWLTVDLGGVQTMSEVTGSIIQTLQEKIT
jgi:homoisocitrate dehydrogenase